MRGLPQSYGNRGLNLPGPRLAPIRGSSLGFYSFLYKYMYDGPAEPLHVARMESLRANFIAMLESVGQPLDAAFRDAVRDAPALNVSRHGAYGSYFDARLRALVARRDAEDRPLRLLFRGLISPARAGAGNR